MRKAVRTLSTIATSIELIDRVSKPINSMIACIGNLCDVFESAERSMDGTFDTSLIEQTRRRIEQTALEVIQLGANTEDAENKQRKYNNAVSHGSSAMDGLIGKVTRLVGAYAGIQGVRKALDLSDTMTSSQARLSLLVETETPVIEPEAPVLENQTYEAEMIVKSNGEEKVLALQNDINKTQASVNVGVNVSGEEKVLALQNQIYEAAQRSRGSYLDMTDSVAKLGLVAGKAFNGTDEIVRFSELLNKNFVVAGASAQESSAAMYQLTQAMGSGRLQGDEYRSIIENAPLLAKSIEDYMVNVQGAKGTMKEWAADGLLTADVIKAALFNSADEIETRFEEMPLTFAQMGTMAKNYLIQAFQPVMARISQIAQSEGFQTFVTGLVSGLTKVSGILIEIINLASQVAQFFSKNWSVIEPIVWGIVTALGAYYTAMLITNTLIGINAIATSVKAAATAMESGATFTATAAQHGFNAALLACPITWIVIAILALIAVIIALVVWFAKTCGAADSAFGVICGGVMVVITFFKNLGLAVANIALGIWNALGACVNNIFTAFHNVICSVQSMWYGLLATVLDVVVGICNALNKLPFISFDFSGIQNMADNYASKAAEANANKKDYEDVGAAFSKGFNTFEYDSYGDAFNKGAAWGDGFTDSVSGAVDGVSNIFDGSAYEGGYDAGQVPSNIATTADNTGSMKDSMDISKEEIKYLRDIAERDAINRFTTAEINVAMTNNNNVSSDMDLDGMVDYLVIGVNEAMATAAEGVH